MVLGRLEVFTGVGDENEEVGRGLVDGCRRCTIQDASLLVAFARSGWLLSGA